MSSSVGRLPRCAGLWHIPAPPGVWGSEVPSAGGYEVWGETSGGPCVCCPPHPVPLPGAQVQGGVWQFSPGLCDALMAMDVMLCTASIFNLCAISADR